MPLLLYPWADFIQISYEYCLGNPLPKLLKRFRSDEQNGRQSKKLSKRQLLPYRLANFIQPS